MTAPRGLQTPDAIVESIELSAPRENVFRALTDPRRLAIWWGSPESYRTEGWLLELWPGGRWSCEVVGGPMGPQRAYGTILEVDAPRRLVWTWNTTWDASGGTTIRYELSAIPRGTLLSVTHSGFADAALREPYRHGWPIVLRWLLTGDAELSALEEKAASSERG